MPRIDVCVNARHSKSIDVKVDNNKLMTVIKEPNAYTSIKKINDFTYQVVYNNLDYEYADKYFREQAEPIEGACSSFKFGNWYGRSFDWEYNNDITFQIATPRANGRYATIGTSGSIKGLTKEFVEKGAISELYKIVPFRVVDGINEYGVVVNTNVVPNQKGDTTGTTPLIETKETFCSQMLPRFILDSFKTATEAVEYIRDYVSVYGNKELREEHDYDIHLMIADKTKCYILEFVDNELVIIEHNMMTNFHISGVEFNSDGSVYTPETQDETHNAMDTNHITSHGAGLERYNLINDASVIDKASARTLLNQLKYTNAYIDTTTPRWYTEGVGEYEQGDLTVKSSVSSCEIVYNAMKELYAERDRETGLTWHSVHSTIYDIENRKAYIIFQENNEELEFNFDYYTAEQCDNKFGTWKPGRGLNSTQTKNNNNAIGEASTADGAETDAHSYASHTEGYMTSTGVNADYSHAEGYKSSTQGVASHTEGDNTVTNNPAEHAQGRYNKSNMGGTTATNTLSSIGIGNASGEIPGGERKNAIEVMQNGDVYIIGIGGYNGKNIDEALTLQEVIRTL